MDQIISLADTSKLNQRNIKRKDLGIVTDSLIELNKTLPPILDCYDSVSSTPNGYTSPILNLSESEREIRHETPIFLQTATSSGGQSPASQKITLEDQNLKDKDLKSVTNSSLQIKPGSTVNKYWKSLYKSLNSYEQVKPSSQNLNDYRNYVTDESRKEMLNIVAVDANKDAKFSNYRIDDIVQIEAYENSGHRSSEDSDLTPKASFMIPAADIDADTSELIELEFGNSRSDEEDFNLNENLPLHELSMADAYNRLKSSASVNKGSSLIGPRQEPFHWGIEIDAPKSSTTTKEFAARFRENRGNSLTNALSAVFKGLSPGSKDNTDNPVTGNSTNELDLMVRVVRGPREMK